MKHFRSILSVLLVFIIVNSIQCMEGDAMDCDSQESYQEDLSKKRKRDEENQQSLTNTQDDLCDTSELKKFKIEEISRDSELFNLPPELLLYIFEYCVALPHNLSYENIINLVKKSCINRAYILLVCKAFSDYKYDLNQCTKKYFNNALKVAVEYRMNHTETEMVVHGIEILTLLKAGADADMTFLVKEARCSNVHALKEQSQPNKVQKSLKDLIFVDILWVNKDLIKTYASQMTDIDSEDMDGNTVLMRAIAKSDLEKASSIFLPESQMDKGIIHFTHRYIYEIIIQALIDHGADVNKLNKKGETALIMLVKYRGGFEKIHHFHKCLSQLCWRSMIDKIDTNIQDNEGNTALMLLCAVQNCNTFKELFRLMAVHANFDLKNKQNKGLPQMARAHRRKFIKDTIAEIELKRKQEKNL